MKRGDVVWLAATEAQCRPSGYCARKDGCARYLVKHTTGRPVVDYSLMSIGIYTGWCAGYMDASKYREPPQQQGGRVHEAPGGIFRG